MALMLMQTMQVNAKASVPHAWAPVMAEALNRAEMGEDGVILIIIQYITYIRDRDRKSVV